MEKIPELKNEIAMEYDRGQLQAQLEYTSQASKVLDVEITKLVDDELRTKTNGPQARIALQEKCVRKALLEKEIKELKDQLEILLDYHDEDSDQASLQYDLWKYQSDAKKLKEAQTSLSQLGIQIKELKDQIRKAPVDDQAIVCLDVCLEKSKIQREIDEKTHLAERISRNLELHSIERALRKTEKAIKQGGAKIEWLQTQLQRAILGGDKDQRSKLERELKSKQVEMETLKARNLKLKVDEKKFFDCDL